MITHTNNEGSVWGTKARVLAAGLLLAASVAVTAGTIAAAPAGASTTFTVNIPGDTNDADTSDNLCDVNQFASGEQCTLRAAIQQSNATTGPDAIRFDIPDSFGTGVKTIHVGATTPSNDGLPEITDPVSIDGYSQPGATPNTLSKGTNAKLMIELDGTEAGISASGLDFEAGGSGSTIRGLVINRFANQGMNVSGQSDPFTDVRIAGNFVGTDPSGTNALPNRGDGIEMDASNSVVGGTSAASRNLISGNDVDGLSVSGDAKDVKIRGNLVGTKADGVGSLANLFNGVDVAGGSAGVSVLGNSIFSNGQLGIDLEVDGRTTNDPGDADAGANGLQNFPEITSAKTASGKTTIKGKLISRPNAGYAVQFFSNPSGTDEGRTFIGQKSITTDGSGNASFTFVPASKVLVGQAITATATKDSNGNTSEFSDPRTVASA